VNGLIHLTDQGDLKSSLRTRHFAKVAKEELIMPNSENFNLKYRPRSYWGPQDLNTHFGARIKGELRRKEGLALLDEGIAFDGVLKSSLSENERNASGAIHPWLMGGEYLPGYESNEVEIARIVMKSTTMDIVSIRARLTKHRIKYRIEDEYDGLFSYTMRPATSTKPLTLQQVINVINLNDLVDGIRIRNYGGYHHGNPKAIFDFCTVSSVFYPKLARWFDCVNAEWLACEEEKFKEESSGSGRRHDADDDCLRNDEPA
jgi:hypothetical protein